MDRGRRSKKKSKDERSKKSSKDSIKPPTPVLGSREEPQPAIQDQYLFLLELFVNHITSDRLAKLNQMFFVPTNICFEFLDFTEADDIEVMPVDPMFQPQAGISDDVEYFFSGRSIMFPIDQDAVLNKILDFIIKLSVRKKMPDGVKPDVLVGIGELDLTKHFAALRKEMLQCWHQMTPPPKVCEGEVTLMYNEDTIGTVNMFVRMSAFGKTIVTEFESPAEKCPSSYVFKGDELNGKSLTYNCRMIDPENMDLHRDSKKDFGSEPPCRVCIKEEHPCLPCGHHAGATLKPNVDNGQKEGCPGVEGQTYPMHASTSASKSNTCADVHKRGGLIQSSRGPAQPCGKAVVLKVSGLLDDGTQKKPTVTVAPESEAVGPDNPPDPEHDVFILRIGKKGLVGADEKSDIQLEMRTPKGPEKRPPLRLETREMQTDEDKGRRDKKGKKKKK